MGVWKFIIIRRDGTTIAGQTSTEHAAFTEMRRLYLDPFYNRKADGQDFRKFFISNGQDVMEHSEADVLEEGRE